MMKRKWNVIWDKKIILDISNDNVINVYSSLLFLSSLSLSLYLPNHQQQHHKKSAAEQQKMQVSVFFAFDEKTSWFRSLQNLIPTRHITIIFFLVKLLTFFIHK